MDKKDLGKIAEFFTDKQNVIIKRELLMSIRNKTVGVADLEENELDKAVKIIRYMLQLYDLSSDMNDKLKQLEKIK
jgi:hypothetical protein